MGSMLVVMVNVWYQIVTLRGRLGLIREEFVGASLVIMMDGGFYPFYIRRVVTVYLCVFS